MYDVHKDFSNEQELFDFSNYLTKSKYFDDSNKLVISKQNDETDGAAIKESVELKPNIYSFCVDDNSEHKKAKGMNKIVVATITHNEYKNIFFE